MAEIKTEDIVNATRGKIIAGSSTQVFEGVAIDSRKIRDNELFVALKGERFDGHDFLYQALEKASGAVVSICPSKEIKDKTIIKVENTLNALQDTARYIRKNKNIPVVGITGTNGKTTTKEITSSILSTKYKVLKNTGNLNNHIGLPLTLTQLSDRDEAVVLEMGASAQGEIKQLCSIAVPDYGVLTNIGRAHLEGFGSIENIRSTKLEMLEFVRAAAVNADDEFMMDGLSGYKGNIVRFGIKNKADVYAKDVDIKDKSSSFTLCIGNKSISVDLKMTGLFNIYNALAAAAVVSLFDIELPSIKAGIEAFSGVSMRLEIKQAMGATVIYDVYNANPVSMQEALKELVRMKKNKTIAVLGDMLELGKYAEEEHRKLGKLLADMQVDVFIAVGPLMAMAESEFSRTSRKSFKLENSSDASSVLAGLCSENDTVLIKGSRGMKMEKVLKMNTEAQNAV